GNKLSTRNLEADPFENLDTLSTKGKIFCNILYIHYDFAFCIGCLLVFKFKRFHMFSTPFFCIVPAGPPVDELYFFVFYECYLFAVLISALSRRKGTSVVSHTSPPRISVTAATQSPMVLIPY